MRSWGDFSSDEKEFFTRLVREPWKDSDPELVSHLEAIKLDMFCREIDLNEITKGNNILDAIDMGLIRHGKSQLGGSK